MAGNTVNGSLTAGGILLTGGKVTNTIIYGNSSAVNVVKLGGTVGYSCAVPAVDGTGNLAADPRFAGPGDYRLSAASPCLDAGTNLAGAASAGDLDGAARVINGRVDMGAYEAVAPDDGALRCGFRTVPDPAVAAGPETLEVAMSAAASGASAGGVRSAWDLDGDGSLDLGWSEAAVVTNAFATGFHTVTLWVTNDTTGESASFVQKDAVRVHPSVVYVSKSGTPKAPYGSPAEAAADLADALAVAGVTGSVRRTVSVAEGTYGCTNVIIDTDMTVTGTGRREATLLNAGDVNPNRVMVVNATGAVVSGVTMLNGYMDSNSDPSTEKASGLWLRAGMVSNCTVRNSRIASNTGSRDMGSCYVAGGLVSGCVIVSNVTDSTPAYRDFRPGNGSPCIDAGLAMPWMAGALDLDGRDRLVRGVPDLGAWEWQARGAGTVIEVR